MPSVLYSNYANSQQCDCGQAGADEGTEVYFSIKHTLVAVKGLEQVVKLIVQRYRRLYI